jgi:hypothetical protein
MRVKRATIGSVLGYRPLYGWDESVITDPMTNKLAEAQLLACITPAKGAGPVGEVDCVFEAGLKHTFPLYEADYDVTVREARTGRVVSTLSVPGTLNGSENCPTVATDTGHTVLLRAPDRNMLAEALRPLSSAPAPR